jgi:hypothetical protein
MATEPDISRIWLTYKTRMNSERRLSRFAVLAHLAITWYSFLLIVMSVFQLQIERAAGTDIASFAIVLSVLLFGLSLIFYGFRFEEKASQFRECYLSLQKLYQSDGSSAEKLREYHRTLDRYPNHSERDYDRLVFDSWRRGTEIYNTDGRIEPTLGLIVKSYMQILAEWLLIFVTFVWPLTVAAILVV